MNDIRKLIQEAQGLSVEQQNRFIEQYVASLESVRDQEKAYRDFIDSLSMLEDQTKALRHKTEMAMMEKELAWLNDPIVNKSEVVRQLYGESTPGNRSYFSQQLQGKRPWKPGQIERLREIKKEKQQVFL